MNIVTRKGFLGQALAAGTFALLNRRVFGAVFDEQGRTPEGVDPHPLFAEDLAADDPRRRQNQFIPAGTRDSYDFRFDKNGTCTFLQLSDFHLCGGRLNSREHVHFQKICDRFKPSFALLTGDNVELRCKGLFELCAGGVAELFQTRQLPFALTFGNHDTEAIGKGWYTAAEQWAYYREVAKGLFIDRHDPKLIGGGASRLRINGEDGKPRFDICLLDSGDYSPYKKDRRTFDSVRAPQVKWARKKLAAGVPTLFFQHIIVPEANEPFGRGLFREARPEDRRFSFRGEAVPYVANEKRCTGFLKEGRGSMPLEHARDPLYLSKGQSIYDVWKNAKNFRGAYFGHDHMNSYDGVTKDGVRLGACKTLSVCGYNDGDLALRVFRVHEDGTFETDTFSEQYPDGTGFWGKKTPVIKG